MKKTIALALLLVAGLFGLFSIAPAQDDTGVRLPPAAVAQRRTPDTVTLILYPPTGPKVVLKVVDFQIPGPGMVMYALANGTKGIYSGTFQIVVK